MAIPTVAEVLKQSGWTQEQIDALDQKARTGIETYVSNDYQTAEQKDKAAQDLAVKAEADRKAQESAAAAAKDAQDAAELAQRTTNEFWNTTYPPAIAAMETEKAKLAKEAADSKAEAAYYKAQRESYLTTLGLKPEDAPVFTPSSNTPPPEPAKTPGTPTFSQDEFLKRVDRGVYSIQDIGWKYQQLYGTPIPVSPSDLVKQADALKLSPMEYAARTYKFAEKEADRRAAEVKAHDDSIAAATAAAKDAEYKAKMEAQANEFAAKERQMAERVSTHPDLRQPPGSAKFTELRRAQKDGERPDPTKMTPEARLKLTQENVKKRFEEQHQQVA